MVIRLRGDAGNCLRGCPCDPQAFPSNAGRGGRLVIGPMALPGLAAAATVTVVPSAKQEE
jgi:hypothetical protein